MEPVVAGGEWEEGGGRIRGGEGGGFVPGSLADGAGWGEGGWLVVEGCVLHE